MTKFRFHARCGLLGHSLVLETIERDSDGVPLREERVCERCIHRTGEIRTLDPMERSMWKINRIAMDVTIRRMKQELSGESPFDPRFSATIKGGKILFPIQYD